MAAAAPGYVIDYFIVDGNRIPGAAGQETYTWDFINIIEDHSVSVSFVQQTWAITFVINSDGTTAYDLSNATVSGGKVTANTGASPGFTAEADTHYHISSVHIDSVLQTDGVFDNSRGIYECMFTSVNKSHSVTVVFAINTYQVNVDIINPSYGSVKYNGQNVQNSITVDYGSEPAFVILPSRGYTFSVSINGIPDSEYQTRSGNAGAKTYTLKSVNANQNVKITFEEISKVVVDESRDVNDYFDRTYTKGLVHTEKATASTPTSKYFLPYNGTAILTPKSGYDGIRYNDIGFDYSLTFSETIFIDKTLPFEIANFWTQEQPGTWEEEVGIILTNSIHIVIDKDDPTVNTIREPAWSNDKVPISSTVTDIDRDDKPSSGIAKVVWHKGGEMTKDEARAEATNVANLSGPELGSEWSFTVSGEQIDTYYVYAVDRAGNVSPAETVEVKIDITPPEITEFEFKKIEPPYVTKIINFLTFGTFYNEAIEVVVSATDPSTGTAASGLKEITLFSDGNIVETKPVTGNSAIFKLNTSDFSDNVISASVIDKAGNVSATKKPTDFTNGNAKSDRVVLKAEAPTVTIVPTSAPLYVNGGENWYSGNVGFDVCVETASVGLHSITIKVNGQVITTDKNGKAIDANFYETHTPKEEFLVNTDYNAVDGLNVIEVIAINNCTTETPESIEVYIDTTNPEVTAFNIDKENGDALSKILNFLTFGNFFNEKVKITVIADDTKGATSGISTITLFSGSDPIGDSPKPVTPVGDGTYEAEFVLPKNVIPDTNLLDVMLSAVATDNVSNITGMGTSHPLGAPVTPTAVNPELFSNRLLIETVNPEISITSSDASYTDGDSRKWYPDDILFTVTAFDADAGIRSVQIKLNDVDILTDIDGKPIDSNFYITETHSEVFRIHTSQSARAEDGSYLIEVTVVDNAGNIYSTSDIAYKDTDNPVIAGYRFVPAASDGISETSDFIERLEYGFYFKTEFTAVIFVSDQMPSSGLDRISYRLVPFKNGAQTDETTGTQAITDGTASISIPKGFKGQIYVEGFDYTGNKSKEVTTQGYVIDDTSPEIATRNNDSTKYHDADGNKLYAADMSFTVTVSDYDSGLKELGYFQSSDKNSFERKSIVIENTGYNIGDSLGDGWTVLEMDCNLVTKATKTFPFTADDNNIVLTLDAYDRSGNRKENVQTEKITIDKTNPIINVVFRDDNDDNEYYDKNRVADITVVERNFNAELIKVSIENTFGAVPSFRFTKVSNTEHTAVIDFGEGDYTLNVSGTDLGNHAAVVNYSGGNERLFFVDKTKPVLEENFEEFEKINPSFEDENNSFNTEKTVKLKVTEHNFDPELVNLRVLRKDPGAEHSRSGMVDATSEVVSAARWESSGDVHTVSFTIDRDAVYQVEVTPTDLAGNASDHRNTVVFEVDKTVPIVTQKNGSFVSEDDTEFFDVYPYSRKDEPVPTVEFDDANIDHIEYDLTVYIADHTNPDTVTVIRPEKVFLDEDEDKSGNIAGNMISLPEFAEDGIYALELTAVDVAGNKSLLNLNTYARLIEQDVLAYILDSNLAKKTGLYSFQYENGEAISKRPDNFSDIKIFVLAKKNTAVDIVLRDNNADEVNTYAQSTTDDSLYGLEIYNYVLESGFFKESFQDDTDAELHLTVKNQDNRIDLGTMHIDNMAPTCEVPEELDSWNWFFGDEERSFTISNISELIDENKCKVYDSGKEIAFKYSSEEDSLTFTLGKGWHNIGIIIDDMAGNANNIQEESNIHIGFFWLWVAMVMSLILMIAIAYVIIYKMRERRILEND